MGVEIDAAICTTHWEMLRAVFGGVQRLSRPEEEKGVRGPHDCIGGGNVLHTMIAFSDIEKFGHRVVGNNMQHSSRIPAPAPAPAPTPVPAPNPGLVTPAATLPRVSSVMEQRRLARLAAAGDGRSSSNGNRGVYHL